MFYLMHVMPATFFLFALPALALLVILAAWGYDLLKTFREKQMLRARLESVIRGYYPVRYERAFQPKENPDAP